MARIQNQFTPAVLAAVTKVISVRFSEEILAEVDQLAETENRTRSNMIIQLIQHGLGAWKKGMRN
jgi:predicted transcriptional regulator